MYFFPRRSARMTVSEFILLEQIRKAAFGTPEVNDAKPQEESSDAEAHKEARHVKLALAAQQTPTEAVNNADHGIQAVPEPPGLRHDGARESNRGNVETKLQEKR